MNTKLIQELPKIELHCHLDGSITPAALKRIADEQGLPFPDSLAEQTALLVAPENCQNLADYLTKFDPVLELLQTEYALELAAFDLIEQVAREHVAYIEVRFSPMLFTRKGLDLDQVIRAVLTGLAKGKETFGVKSNALLCGMRHHDEDKNNLVVEAAKNFLNQGVAGFDLAGDEASFPPELFQDTLELARNYQIPLTLHAGECGCPLNVRESILLGATRIGHGVALQKDDAVMSLCLEKDILIEMCPTSNLQTKAVASMEDYPFLDFLNAGLKVCINTDNRTVSNTTLTKEYSLLADTYGLSFDTFEKINHFAVDGAFLTSTEKNDLHTYLSEHYQKISKEHSAD